MAGIRQFTAEQGDRTEQPFRTLGMLPADEYSDQRSEPERPASGNVGGVQNIPRLPSGLSRQPLADAQVLGSGDRNDGDLLTERTEGKQDWSVRRDFEFLMSRSPSMTAFSCRMPECTVWTGIFSFDIVDLLPVAA